MATRSRGMAFQVSLVLVVVAAVLVLVVIVPCLMAATPKQMDDRTTCLSNLKQLNLALLMYADDWDGRLPLAKNWPDALMVYMRNRNLLHCPADKTKGTVSYALNTAVVGRNIERLGSVEQTAQTVLIFETRRPGKSPVGTVKDVASPPRHIGGNNYGYCDGHANWMKKAPSFTSVLQKGARGRYRD